MIMRVRVLPEMGGQRASGLVPPHLSKLVRVLIGWVRRDCAFSKSFPYSCTPLDRVPNFAFAFQQSFCKDAFSQAQSFGIFRSRRHTPEDFIIPRSVPDY